MQVGESNRSAEKKLSRSRFSFASFLLKRKEGGRFLFLKKRNKRHCGTDDLSEKGCFPAHSAWSIKTDGSHTNRPFCGAGWRKQQERRKEAQPQSIFFCFFSSKKKRRWFIYEPPVLCIVLTKATKEQKESCSAIDFLLRGRLARESWRAGAADTGRDKAEEGGIPAAVFRPTTTQDVPASVRLRACASRASLTGFSF